ncbi:Pycsar system effector family protein [Alteraurantiacibacter aquimixticola]|uniref:Pycsar effector protein domain-containing protein n=1 Tax=Alteraurantiacibacter aquimixticola TaxID=2489173 RepID=A0A4T3EXT4_9SPHN|nr:Pycsar system effector family protein [Alteraurantiacibacter aquimixticola]TIX49396.1 hypothetical protein E5222_11095 [Alteraurantiacibacter aquimixticola]
MMTQPSEQGSGAEDEAPAGLPQYTPQAVQMLRTVQVNTLMLSQMADQKASILMGATFLVFSIAVSRSLAGDLPYSLAILAVFAFLSSLCAVMAVLPSVGKADPGDRANLLFFGHFCGMEEGQWTEDVLKQMRHDDHLFRVMLHDIYQNGQVLQRRKYRYLSLAYRIFIGGLFVTLTAFAVELGLSR